MVDVNYFKVLIRSVGQIDLQALVLLLPVAASKARQVFSAVRYAAVAGFFKATSRGVEQGEWQTPVMLPLVAVIHQFPVRFNILATEKDSGGFSDA